MIKFFLRHAYDYIVFLIVIYFSIFSTTTTFYYASIFSDFLKEVDNLNIYMISKEGSDVLEVDYDEGTILEGFESPDRNDEFKELYNCINNNESVSYITLGDRFMYLFDPNSEVDLEESPYEVDKNNLFPYNYYYISEVFPQGSLEEEYKIYDLIEGVTISNNNEIMVSQEFIENSGYNLNDVIELGVFDSYDFNSVNSDVKEYKIVGVYVSEFLGYITLSSAEVNELSNFEPTSIFLKTENITDVKKACGQEIDDREMVITDISKNGINKYEFIKVQKDIFRICTLASIILSFSSYIIMFKVLDKKRTTLEKIKSQVGYSRKQLVGSFIGESVVLFLIAYNIFILTSDYVKNFINSVFVAIINSKYLIESTSIFTGNKTSLLSNYHDIIFDNMTNHILYSKYDSTMYYVSAIVFLVYIISIIIVKVRKKHE